jgi:YggT family protein
VTIVHEVLYLYTWVLVAAALLSWFPNPGQGLATVQHVLARLTEPLLRPLRAILPRPRVGGVGIDLSVLVAIILIQVVNTFI